VCPAIDNLGRCESRAVIRFLHAKNTSAAEIHIELCAAVDDRIGMSEGTVSQRCRIFKDGGGRTNIYDEERSSRLAICS
jgi:hypothetical protein